MDIVITSQVMARINDRADPKREAAAFRDLSNAMVANPSSAIDRFLEIAITLCKADAAGLGLLDATGEIPIFRWSAVAGAFQPLEGKTFSQEHSASTMAQEAQEPIVVLRPGRMFSDLAEIAPGVEEALIIPLYDNGGAFTGTVWVAHTQPEGGFCANDIRLIGELAVQLVLALKLAHDEAETRDIRQLLDGAGHEDNFNSGDGAQFASPGEGLRSEGELLQSDLADFVEASAFRNSVLASSGDCIKVIDLEGRIRFMNSGGLGLMEVTDPSAVIGLDWLSVWTGEVAILAREAFEAARHGEPTRFRGSAATFAGTLKHWDVQLTPIRHNQTGVSHVLAISRDMTEHQLVEAQRELLARELDHRIKNILAMVVAVAHQTLRPPASLEDASEAFTARMSALGKAQSILTNSSWNSADIRLVVEGALAIHRGAPDDSRFRVEGPSLQLAPNKALSLALALHELTTNAMKYGALSVDGGHISVHWRTVGDGDGQFLLEWREQGGPAVTEPSTRGFGSRLVERALAAEFRGKVRIDFESRGVICTLTAPVKEVSAAATA